MLEKKKGKRGKFDIEATMKSLSEESIAKERISDWSRVADYYTRRAQVRFEVQQIPPMYMTKQNFNVIYLIYVFKLRS